LKKFNGPLKHCQ